MAEVKKTEPSKIVILVKGNKKTSREFGAELAGELYRVIQGYNWFQKEEEPTVKVSFKDKKGNPQNYALGEILDEDSLVKCLVEPPDFMALRDIAITFAKRLPKFESLFESIEVGIKGIKVKFK